MLALFGVFTTLQTTIVQQGTELGLKMEEDKPPAEVVDAASDDKKKEKKEKPVAK